jgi:hypothetical protein
MNSLSPFMETIAGGVLALPDDFSPGNLLLPLALSSMPALPDWLINALKFVMPVLSALLILALGWIISGFIAAVVGKLLKRTTIDDRLSEMLSGNGRNQISVENIVVLAVRWIVMLMAVVAALDALKLTMVSVPLNAFLTSILQFLPKLGGAIGLLAVAWLLATLVKGLAEQLSESFDLDARLNSASADSTISVTDTLGNALYWLVFLFFVPLVLNALGLQEGPLAPVQGLLAQFLSAIPQILKAVAIGAVFWFIAQIVRNVVTNVLAATGVDQIGRQVGISPESSGQSLSGLAGLVAYIFVLVPGVIAALRELNISAISDPATNMLGQFMSAIPLVIAAAVILGVAYFVGKLIADLTTSLLSGMGFDATVGRLGINLPEGGQTPSKIVGTIVLVATVLVALVPAVAVFKLDALTSSVTGLLQIAGQTAVGVAIFGAGLFLANWVADLIKSAGMREGNLLATAARVGILIFSGAMALRQVGVATDIVNLTFGLLLGAMAVAIAIAFGLGGRDVAAEQLRDWVKPFKR